MIVIPVQINSAMRIVVEMLKNKHTNMPFANVSSQNTYLIDIISD